MEEGSMMPHYDLLVIGGSAGSLDVVLNLLPRLRSDLQLSIVIVLHRKSGTDSALTDLFSSRTNLIVKEAEEKEQIEKGTIYIAPADYHLLIENDKTFSLDFSEKVNFSRPSIDVTFETAAEAYGSSLACLLLSGANMDGTNGLKAVKEMEGLVLVQDPDSAEVAYMPQQAIKEVAVDYILRPEQMATVINKLY